MLPATEKWLRHPPKVLLDAGVYVGALVVCSEQ